MSTDVYADAAAMIRERLLARPGARGQGRSNQFLDRTVRLGVWFLRKHGPYGERIFSACRMVLARILKLKDCAVRTSIAALQEIGLLHHLPRANGHERKWRSPEYAAFQFQLGADFALLFPVAQTRQIPDKKEELERLPVSGGLIPRRTWDRRRPELRLPSKIAVRRAWEASLEALKGLPLPRLSPQVLGSMPGRREGPPRPA